MYSVIIEGTEEFLLDSAIELVSKGMKQIGVNVLIVNSINNFDSISRGLKNLSSYKKQQSKNIIYKTSSLAKIN